MVDEPRRHVHDQDVGEARFLKAGDAREKKSGAILVRPFVKVDLGNVHLGKQELNGMDVEAEVEQNDELELSSGSLFENLFSPGAGDEPGDLSQDMAAGNERKVKEDSSSGQYL